MIKKSVLLLGMFSPCLINTASAAGLTLVSKNISPPIAVYCNEKKGLFDINPNNQLGPLPWVLISGMFQSSDLHCSFKLDNGSNTELATAHMTITSDTGTITDVKLNDPAHYIATSTTPWGTPNTETTVTLSKTS